MTSSRSKKNYKGGQIHGSLFTGMCWTGVRILILGSWHTTGSAFGEGIYMSTDMQLAFSFSQPAESWSRSALGRRLRCLLVCELSGDEPREPSEAGAHDGCGFWG